METQLTAELRLDAGTLVQFRQGKTPTRIGLGLNVPDPCAAARALDRIPWTVPGPNVIQISRGDLTVDATEGAPGLVAVTLSVADVDARARFRRTLGLTVTDANAAAADADPEPDEPAVDVQLDGVLNLRECGVRPGRGVFTRPAVETRLGYVSAVAGPVDKPPLPCAADTLSRDGCVGRVQQHQAGVATLADHDSE